MVASLGEQWNTRIVLVPGGEVPGGAFFDIPRNAVFAVAQWVVIAAILLALSGCLAICGASAAFRAASFEPRTSPWYAGA